MIEFRNESGLKFEDVSSELERTYFFPSGYEVTIELPQFQHIDQKGNHIIFDADGTMHVVAPDWFYMRWETKEGAAHLGSF